jgi:hypothetical protein
MSDLKVVDETSVVTVPAYVQELFAKLDVGVDSKIRANLIAAINLNPDLDEDVGIPDGFASKYRFMIRPDNWRALPTEKRAQFLEFINERFDLLLAIITLITHSGGVVPDGLDIKKVRLPDLDWRPLIKLVPALAKSGLRSAGQEFTYPMRFVTACKITAEALLQAATELSSASKA